MARLPSFFICLSGLAMGIYPLGCATLSPMNSSHDHRFADNSIWTDEPHDPPKAVVLMLHGLNLKPARMDGWAQLLSAHGAKVMRFALHGHAGPQKLMTEVKAQIWREQFDKAIQEAFAQAQKLQVPLYFVGFSLGALVALEWLSAQPETKLYINKMLLIAPAIATPWYSQAAANILSIFSKSLSLPSRSPKQYRANKGTTVAAYEALFTLKKSLEEAGFKNANLPTLVLIDKHDELVPSARVKNIIADHSLGRWQLSIVDNHFAQENYGFRHLMVDQESVGPNLWAELSEQVIKYLDM